MEIVQKATELGYRHYADLTIEEIDDLPIGDDDKYMEYCRIAKWLREHYRAHIIIEPRYIKENCTLTGKVDYYCWRGFVHVDPSTVGGVENTYEEALEKGLKTLIIAIKTKDPRVMHYRNSLLKISPYKPL